MRISRNLALKILNYQIQNPKFYFPFTLYSIELDEEIFKDDLDLIKNNEELLNFNLIENLQNLDETTLELMTKGFIEKILSEESSILLEKDFIFITFEGMTFQPNNEAVMPDIENMQVIGFSKGKNSKEAFENLKIKSPYLFDTTFEEIIAIELKEKKFEYFNLK